MKRVAIASTICAGIAAAALASGGMGAGGFQPASGLTSLPSNVETCTTASTKMYVDKAGDDGNACTSPGTGACLTIQAALNKAPHCLRNDVVVEIDAGVYAAFSASGFRQERGYASTQNVTISGVYGETGGLSGPSHGTASGGSAGDLSAGAFGTIQQLDAGWAANELVGHFLITTGPTARFPVYSNDATTVTVNNVFGSAPTSSTTYVVADAVSVIDGGTTVIGENVVSGNSAMLLSQLLFQSTQTATINMIGPGAVTLNGIQVRNSASGGLAIRAFTPQAPSWLSISNDDVITSGSGSSIALSPGGSLSSVSLTGSRFAGTGSSNYGLRATDQSGVPTFLMFLRNSFSGFDHPISLESATMTDSLNPSVIKVACRDSTGTGVLIGGASPGLYSAHAWLDWLDVQICGTGVSVQGPSSSLFLRDYTGSIASAGTALSSTAGGYIQYSGSLMLADAGTLYSVDGTTTTAIASGSCSTNTVAGTRICNGATTTVSKSGTFPCDGGTPAPTVTVTSGVNCVCGGQGAACTVASTTMTAHCAAGDTVSVGYVCQ